ncbi:MAG TPA: type 1 glutamine amidotransferase [Solirubrobacteraceae bacterium]|nr:type 1 glutamine amidotransferase [Solirubrobacteraceae bacterium]
MPGDGVKRSPILVLQHAGCEPPGAYEDELLARRIPFTRVRLDLSEELPDWRAYAGIVAMGGSMSVNDEAAHPWLVGEKRLIAAAVEAGVPYWGVCLGAQLLAASLGARVMPGERPELGMLAVELTGAAAGDPVFAAAPASFQTLQWHGETYELPKGAVQLARSHACEQQAFAVGGAYALQFHLEVGSELAREWMLLPEFAQELEQEHGAGAPEELLAQLGEAETAALALARSLFSRWLQEVVGYEQRAVAA